MQATSTTQTKPGTRVEVNKIKAYSFKKKENDKA